MRPVRSAYGFAIALWLASLALPAAQVNETMRLMGYRAFMLGIEALGSGIPGWLANPMAAAAVVAGWSSRMPAATVLATAALLLALSSYRAPATARAGGLPIEQVSFDVGFFLWLAAFSMIFAASLYGWIAAARARRSG